MGAPAIASMAWSECLVPATEAEPGLVAEIRKQMGAVPDWVSRVAPSPWLARAVCELVVKPLAHAQPDLCELVVLVVSQDNSCRYCYGVQRALLKISGYREEYIDRLERDLHAANLSQAERAVLEFARKLSRANPRPSPAEREELVRLGFSRPALAEVVFVAASTNFTNRTATLLALPPDTLESMVKRPVFRFLRPFVAWRMRPKPRHPEPLPRPNDGPFAAAVAALEGSPTATTLRRVIDAAWASPILPRRTKALMFAVIARALGCAYSETEARRLLASEGLAVGEVDEVLANLGSPKLDAREARLVPFARETVRYQTATIQRRMRELAPGLSAPEILETVGVVSLANAIGRLSVLV